MARILKKPWKTQQKKLPTSLLSYEQRQRMKEEKKVKTAKKQEIIQELRRKKREYFDTVRAKKEGKRAKREEKMRLLGKGN